MHHVTRIARRGVLGLLLLALLASVGCKSAAGHTVNAVGRFAVGTLTSGGNPVAGAQSAALGTAIDVARDPKGEQFEDQRPKIVTVYSARRAARLAGPVGQCLIERGDETVEANFKTVLERGDVLRFQR